MSAQGVTPMAIRLLQPAPEAKTRGMTPKMKDQAVMSTERNDEPASEADSVEYPQSDAGKERRGRFPQMGRRQEGQETTRLIMRPGTRISLRMVLPARWGARSGQERAAARMSSLGASAGTRMRARSFPLI